MNVVAGRKRTVRLVRIPLWKLFGSPRHWVRLSLPPR